MKIYDFAAGAVTALPVEPAANVAALAWSPDGQRIAVGCCFAESFSDTGEYLGTTTGELRVVDLATEQAEAVGPLWRSVAGSVQPFCWTEGDKVTAIEQGDTPSGHCSTPPDRSLAPDGRRFYLNSPTPDAQYQLVVVSAGGEELWRRDLPADLGPVAWSPDGESLLLDDTAANSPIWRIHADGKGEPEIVVDDGYLLQVVGNWN